MGVNFQIADKFIDIDTIKEYRIENVKYIYRPRYLKDRTLVNKVSHKVYTFKDMEPYKPYDESIALDDVPYAIINANGSLDEEKTTVINKSTQEFHYTEVRNVDSLVIVADKEYVFYGSGIDCVSAKASLERLKLLIKNSQKSTKKAVITNKVLTEGQSYTQKGIAWFKGLNTNNKIIVGCVAMFVVVLLICFIGAATENDKNQEPTDAETTIEYVSDTTEKQITTGTTEVETTEETTEETTMEESTVEITTDEYTDEIETESVVDVVEDEPETEQIEYTTEKKSGRTVYITPTGEKYHCSSACAGKNAIARDYDDVEGVYDPCKKCVY